MKRIVLASLLALGVAAPALAQSKSSSKAAPAPITYKQTTRINIGDDEVVEGGTTRPDLERVDGWRERKFPSFIKLRADFVPEMIKSSRDL
jgi:hypothetical protein